MSTKLPLRDEIRQAVLQRILRGELPPGSRIVESKLSETLGVSRTPLREALLHLEQQGFVRADLAKGFSVEPLSQREVREIYPIIWTLEGLALRSVGPLLKASLPELSRINHSMAAAEGDPALALELDTQWHQALLKHCPNQRLLMLLAGLKLAAHRYEYLCMDDGALIATSVAQHTGIIEAIANHKLELAIDRLEENWQFGMELLLQRIADP